MQKSSLLLLLLLPLVMWGQQPGQQPGTAQQSDKKTSKHWKGIGIGVKGGFDFANVTNASSINASTRAGFNVGLFFEPPSKHIISSRTELNYSRRGFNYDVATTSGSVNLDYVQLTQMMSINITSYASIQFGGYTSYLLSVKNDSNQITTGNAMIDQELSLYNRFDYGFGGGVEIHPVLGVLVGARYSLSLNNLYKQTDPGLNVNFKNNVVQVFVGYRF